jgi:hypothetical protein
MFGTGLRARLWTVCCQKGALRSHGYNFEARIEKLVGPEVATASRAERSGPLFSVAGGPHPATSSSMLWGEGEGEAGGGVISKSLATGWLLLLGPNRSAWQSLVSPWL